MSRVSKLSRWVAGGLLCAAGAAIADEATQAPAPRAVERTAATEAAPAPRAIDPYAVTEVPLPPFPATPAAPVKPARAPVATPTLPTKAPVTAPATKTTVAAPVKVPAALAPTVPAPTIPSRMPALRPNAAPSPGGMTAFQIEPPAPAAPPRTPAPLTVFPIEQPQPAAQPKPADQPPRDTTRQPIDRLLQPASPTSPNVIDAAAQASYAYFPTLGFAGPSGVQLRSGNNNEYDTIEDRWRIGFPEWDRYGLGHPRVFDYPYQLGQLWDPYRQNVIKGDYPIIGQHTFLNITGTSSTLFEGRMIPTATTPFESTIRPFTTEFFGRPGQFIFNELTTLSFDLFHGDAAFKPNDWRLKLTPAFNYNSLNVEELAVVSPDVRKGLHRNRGWWTLQEWFGEVKLADLSPQYDFVSIRAGSQPFTSDFRGFIFSDVNRGVRLFGNYDGNRTQYNLAYFRQLDKDVNSQLNTFTDRDQDIIIANIYRQDFIFPGYTAQASFHYNNDAPDFQFDKNGFLVRPDPAGVFRPHRVEAYYFGFAGDGHIDRYNISHAAYWVIGRDSRNPIAGQPTNINAQFAALELSYDRDWARFRMSGLYQSGDGNANNGHATGFDGIIDNQNFGGEFSFWRRQRIPLFGVGLTNDQSQFANLRSSRIQGQSNFVNPGLWLINSGVDFDVTPRLRSINNVNVLFFDKTNSLETFVFQSNIDRFVGVDLSTGAEWRPRLNNNAIFMGGFSCLIPGGSFRQLYNNKESKVPALFSGFLEVILTF